MSYPENTVLKIAAREYAWHWLVTLGLLAGLAGTVQAQARFSYSAGGAEVTDAKTGLIWQRCSAGQSWSGGTCTGDPNTYTHEEALAYAKTQSGWRLPNIKELSSLVDRRVRNPSLDVVTFPATPAFPYWSASPYVGTANGGWRVQFNEGGVVGDGYRGYGYHVRLVRR